MGNKEAKRKVNCGGGVVPSLIFDLLFLYFL